MGQNNDFASLYPDLAVQWDTRKNAPRKPSEFPAGSHHLAWWVCEKGHSWRAPDQFPGLRRLRLPGLRWQAGADR
ncbi:MAG: zinc-ribbon domain-containing protein [Dysosmobacter sp.]